MGMSSNFRSAYVLGNRSPCGSATVRKELLKTYRCTQIELIHSKDISKSVISPEMNLDGIWISQHCFLFRWLVWFVCAGMRFIFRTSVLDLYHRSTHGTAALRLSKISIISQGNSSFFLVLTSWHMVLHLKSACTLILTNVDYCCLMSMHCTTACLLSMG